MKLCESIIDSRQHTIRRQYRRDPPRSQPIVTSPLLTLHSLLNGFCNSPSMPRSHLYSYSKMDCRGEIGKQIHISWKKLVWYQEIIYKLLNINQPQTIDNSYHKSMCYGYWLIGLVPLIRIIRQTGWFGADNPGLWDKMASQSSDLQTDSRVIGSPFAISINLL